MLNKNMFWRTSPVKRGGFRVFRAFPCLPCFSFCGASSHPNARQPGNCSYFLGVDITYCASSESADLEEPGLQGLSIRNGSDTCSWVTIHWPFVSRKPAVTRTQ